MQLCLVMYKLSCGGSTRLHRYGFLPTAVSLSALPILWTRYMFHVSLIFYQCTPFECWITFSMRLFVLLLVRLELLRPNKYVSFVLNRRTFFKLIDISIVFTKFWLTTAWHSRQSNTLIHILVYSIAFTILFFKRWKLIGERSNSKLFMKVW